MKVTSCNIRRAEHPLTVMDCFVDRGLKPQGFASMPDIDVDYASDRRQEMKDYLESRYNTPGQQRVFSAGTFSTLKLKAAIKDVARVHRVPHAEVNYLMGMLDDDLDWTGLFRAAALNRRVRSFIHNYPQVIEQVRGILGQPRSASIHASAIIVTPEQRDGVPAECFDFLPIRKMDGLLVSEFDGYAVDEIGLLKEDVLATKELAKLSATISLVNTHYGRALTLEHITQCELDDSKTYRLLAEGYTQNIFQFSSPGITRFIQDVKPTSIEDLIAVNALYRPATLDVGAAEDFIRLRRGEAAPVYNYGCYEATQSTYGLLCFQEQFMSIAHTLGGFDLGKTDLLRKAIGKKKADLMATLRADFLAGAIANGCPDYEAMQIWHKIEAAGAYGFNKCISAKERILWPTHALGRPSVGEMYHIRHDRAYAQSTGHKSLHVTYRSEGYGAAFSLNEENRLVKNRIKDIRYMGVRPLYRITLENGATLEVTNNHKHPTQRGTVRTDMLVPDEDFMFVTAGDQQQIKELGEQGLLTRLERIVSVDYMGEEDVYDVEMEAPYHTFVTEQGVVTCNSHSAAYALTAYCGAWLKANYPSAFYTVALQWADEGQIAQLMGEMEACSTARIVAPDINRSREEFYTDYSTQEIYWSLVRIRQVGQTAAEHIVAERERAGAFTGIQDFLRRIFGNRLRGRTVGSPTPRQMVNARHVKHLILAGCFDKVEGLKSVTERLAVLRTAARQLGFEIDQQEFPPADLDKQYFWSQRQIAVSGIGEIDYRRLYDNSPQRKIIKGRNTYLTLQQAADSSNEGRRAVLCATVAQVEEASYMDKTSGEPVRFAKLRLQQNTAAMELVCWSDFYAAHRTLIQGLRGKVIILTALIRYSEYTGSNALQTYKTSHLSILE